MALLTFIKWALKLLLVVFLTGFVWVYWFTENNPYSFPVALFVLFGFLLPSIFVFFVKPWLVARNPGFERFWKFGRIAYAIVVVIFIIFFIWVFYFAYQILKTDAAIDRINATRINFIDVDGSNLPPAPDQIVNDATLEGIDANSNNIRDDVELAIFAKYPDSAKIRAAMLQYAQALQLELTEVFNSETLIGAIQKEELAYGCLAEAEKKAYGSYAVIDDQEKEINDLVVDTIARKNKIEDIYDDLTGHAYKNGPKCDIDLNSLN